MALLLRKKSGKLLAVLLGRFAPRGNGANTAVHATSAVLDNGAALRLDARTEATAGMIHAMLTGQPKVTTAIGVVLVAGGAIALYYGYENQASLLALAAVAAIIAGAVALMYGVSSLLNPDLPLPAPPPSMHNEAHLRLLVQCMGTVAAADGQISEDELATISRIHQRMVGHGVPAAQIAAMVAERKGPAVLASLRAQREALPLPLRQTIVKCCYLVMMSDLDEARTEIGRVREIGKALGFSAQQIDDLFAMAGV
jgi:uncharacterized membrane protein YebE (DUF533 family)